MRTATELADGLIETMRVHDASAAMRQGDLTHPERWPLRRVEEVEAYRVELLSLADEAAELLGSDITSADRVLADAVVYGGRAKAMLLDTSVELTGLNAAIGDVSRALTFLPRHALPTADHGDRYLIRLAGFGPFVDAWCERLEHAAAEGIVPNRHAVTSLIEQIDRTLDAGCRGVLSAQVAPAELDDAAAAAWRGDVERHADDMDAALRRLRTTVSEHTLPVARGDDRPGLCHLEGGDEIYRRLLWAHTSLDTTPEEVHRAGLAVLERLEDEYRAIAGPQLGTDDVHEIYRRLRDDTSLRYQSAEHLVADATSALTRAWEAAPQWFTRLPTAACTAHPIEQGALAFYSPPSPDGAKQGEFFFNTADPSFWATYQLEAVAFHEGVPGHHLQLALAIELDEVHPLLETYLAPAYCEGWGLYTERLAEEMGLYSSDLDRIGMLSADSMRACRLVVDTGLHAFGWSRQQAIDFVATNSPLDLGQIAGEIDRYIGMPGQACSYMMGRLAIDEIRADAQRALGAEFDVAEFHDVVLGSGSVPLETLRGVVAGWTADRGPA